MSILVVSTSFVVFNFAIRLITVLECASDELVCPTGRCILHSDVCNYANDCGDNWDEQNCSKRCILLVPLHAVRRRLHFIILVIELRFTLYLLLKYDIMLCWSMRSGRCAVSRRWLHSTRVTLWFHWRLFQSRWWRELLWVQQAVTSYMCDTWWDSIIFTRIP